MSFLKSLLVGWDDQRLFVVIEDGTESGQEVREGEDTDEVVAVTIYLNHKLS